MIKAKLEKITLNIWYEKKIRFLYCLSQFILRPLSWIYFFIIIIRKYFYNKNIIGSYKSKLPIIVVGNITVGGTGKTPIVITLVTLLQDFGLKPGVITRGYKGNNNKSILASKNLSAEIIGDEARLLVNRLQCPIAVGANRIESVKLLEHTGLCNIIISDDGLQHYKIERDLQICVIDGERLLGNEQLLPAGPLREYPCNLANFDWLLIKQDKDKIYDLESLPASLYKELTARNNKKLYSFNLQPLKIVNLVNNSSYDINHFTNKFINNSGKYTIYAYAAIGNNNNFYNSLIKLGINNFITRSYTDHYKYKLADISVLNNNKNIIITTEKDAVKLADLIKLDKSLQASANIFVIPIDSSISEDFKISFLKKINILRNQYNIKLDCDNKEGQAETHLELIQEEVIC